MNATGAPQERGSAQPVVDLVVLWEDHTFLIGTEAECTLPSATWDGGAGLQQVADEIAQDVLGCCIYHHRLADITVVTAQDSTVIHFAVLAQVNGPIPSRSKAFRAPVVALPHALGALGSCQVERADMVLSRDLQPIPIAARAGTD